jgi:hypothetical protein
MLLAELAGRISPLPRLILMAQETFFDSVEHG